MQIMICLQAKSNTRIKYNKNGKNFKKSDWKVVKKENMATNTVSKSKKSSTIAKGRKTGYLASLTKCGFL